MGTEGVMTMMCEPFTEKREVCLLNFTSFRMVLRTVSGEENSDREMTTRMEGKESGNRHRWA